MTGTEQNLTIDDAKAILDGVPEVEQVAPAVSGRAQIKYYENNTGTSVMGVTATYLPLRNFEIEKGRLFTDGEDDRMARVIILGPVTAENLFGKSEAVGETVKVNGVNFEVIGVTKAKGDQGWFNPDDNAFVPCTLAMKQLFGLEFLREINIKCKTQNDLDKVQDEVIQVMRKRHRTQPGMPNDIEIRNQADILSTATQVTRTFTILLGAVASISLLVGGIGIMNIMLVTVTERTREIGIRKAIGAKDRDILRQFLFEAILMSGIGGVIGVAAGVGAAKALAVLTSFTTVLNPSSIVMAMLFSAAVGIFFGYYPARRAAKLNPIDALRYE